MINNVRSNFIKVVLGYIFVVGFEKVLNLNWIICLNSVCL